jgi:hypothetical protein
MRKRGSKPVRDVIIRNMRARFDAWLDLANSIEADLVERELPVEKSKSLKAHFWCRHCQTKSVAHKSA